MKKGIILKSFTLSFILFATSSLTHAGPTCGATPCIDGDDIKVPLTINNNTGNGLEIKANVRAITAESQGITIRSSSYSDKGVGLEAFSSGKNSFGLYSVSVGTGAFILHSKSKNKGIIGTKDLGVLGKHEVSGNVGTLGTKEAGVRGYSSKGYAGLFEGKVLAKKGIEVQGDGIKFQDGSIQNTASIIPQITRVQKDFLLNPNSSSITAWGANSTFVTAAVSCPPDYKVLGGGWDHWRNNQSGHNHDHRVHAYFSHPENETWQVGIRNNTEYFMAVRVYATCVKGI